MRYRCGFAFVCTNIAMYGGLRGPTGHFGLDDTLLPRC